LPGAAPLPALAGDEAIDPVRVGGDLLLALHASDATVLHSVLTALRARLGEAARLRWPWPDAEARLCLRDTGGP
jgi:hypothetical protein